MTSSSGSPYEEWITVHVFDTEMLAAAYANFLNGGDGKFPVNLDVA
jgi:hypothetical protein